jgi:uncharacterized membrane protein
MKYETEVEIALPREKVIELFDNTENLKKWQKGLLSFEHESGEAGNEGAVSRLKYKMGSREIEMTETITKRNLPEEFTGIYETKGMWNQHENYFKEDGEHATKWKTISEFKSDSFFMKMMMTLMPSSFKKQTKKMMIDFKNFAESES